MEPGGAESAMKPPRDEADAIAPGVIVLIEEAVHLLRCAPPGSLAVYYAGAGPWAVGFLFFWAHASWFAPTGAQLAWNALGLAALYVWLKVAQAEFCARLMAQRTGGPVPAWSVRRVARLAGTQARIHAWGPAAVPLAALLTAPFAWVWTFFQNATVLGGGESGREPTAETAWAQARLWPRQGHLVLPVFGALALCVWINLAVAFHVVPWLANRLLGVENFMSFRGWSWLNTTFLSLVTALAWLVVDPLIKAFYVLRVFYGRAQRTGEDLRIELAAARPARSGGAKTLAVLLAAGLLASLRPAEAAATAAGPAPAAAGPAVDVRELDRAIDGVLVGRDFQWQLRPLPAAETDEADGPVKAFFKQAIDLVEEVAKTIQRLVKRIGQWLDELLPQKEKTEHKADAPAAGGGLTVLRALLYGLIAVALILIGVVLYLAWKQDRRGSVPVAAARAVAAAKPDLADENIQAAQLPADGWLALAREQMAAGEWRLALRALYLASLARLGAEGLLTLAKFKTNLDYERELGRRALLHAGLVAWFGGRRREFEDAWYGRAQPGEAQVRAWLADMEKGSLP